MATHTVHARTTPSAGFTLVEMVVAIVILAVGLTGLAQLHWFSQRSSSISVQRTIAHVQALDLGERMWVGLASPLGGIGEWETIHEGELPGWTGTVTQLGGDPELYRIRIEWSQPGAPEPPEYEYLVRVPRVAVP